MQVLLEELASPAEVRPVTLETNAEGAAITIEWARRRLSMYEQIDRLSREAVTAILATATQVRSDIESDAANVRRRLDEESADLARRSVSMQRDAQRLAEELQTVRQEAQADLHAKQGAAEEELQRYRNDTLDAAKRARAEHEHAAAELRTITQQQIEQYLVDARARRTEIDAEVVALQEQMSEIQQVLDGFMDSQRRSLLGAGGQTMMERLQAQSNLINQNGQQTGHAGATH